MTLTAVKAPQARGMIFIHSTPVALCPHVEWALGEQLGGPVTLKWESQPVEANSRRAEFSWVGPAGAAAGIASKLAGFQRLRFEVTEEASPGADGQRFSYTPALGSFACVIGVHGDVLVNEQQIKHAVARDALGGETLHHALDRLLGGPWDEELEVFRHASDDVPVRWLHQVV